MRPASGAIGCVRGRRFSVFCSPFSIEQRLLLGFFWPIGSFFMRLNYSYGVGAK